MEHNSEHLESENTPKNSRHDANKMIVMNCNLRGVVKLIQLAHYNYNRHTMEIRFFQLFIIV